MKLDHFLSLADSLTNFLIFDEEAETEAEHELTQGTADDVMKAIRAYQYYIAGFSYGSEGIAVYVVKE